MNNRKFDTSPRCREEGGSCAPRDRLQPNNIEEAFSRKLQTRACRLQSQKVSDIMLEVTVRHEMFFVVVAVLFGYLIELLSRFFSECRYFGHL